MTPTRLVVVAGCLMLSVAAVGLQAGLDPPAGRVNIRWAEAASESDRVALEHAHHLIAPRQQQGTTWSYRLRDASVGNIQRLVENPLVEDTNNIDRTTFALAREPSVAPEWVRRINRSPALSSVSYLYAPFAGAFALVAFVAAWPGLKSVGARIRPTRTSLNDPVWTRRALVMILFASLVLRISLVWSGGQFYWPDEGRYDHSRKIVQEVAAGDYQQALVRLSTPDSPFFRLVGTVPATFEYLIRFDTRIPAIFFSVFSLLNIWLIGRVASRLGASPAESLFASALLALSCSFLYYSRHLLPLDLALTAALLAMYVGVNPSGGVLASIACGSLAACTFYLYAGYWLLTVVSVFIHALDARTIRDAIRRLIWSGLGAVPIVGAVFGISAATGAHPIDALVSHASVVTQGAFDEGWRLPAEYLWHAEHLLLIGWMAGVLYWLFRPGPALRTRRIRYAFAALLLIYGMLAIPSTVLHAFVVYGRTARSLVPFLCLIAAAALEHMRMSSHASVRRLVPAVFAVIVAQATFNFATPLRQLFPLELLKEAEAVGDLEIEGVKTIYTSHIFPVPKPFTLPPGFVVLREARHPLQYLPYQYEGYDPAQRLALRSQDLRMRVIVPAAQ